MSCWRCRGRGEVAPYTPRKYAFVVSWLETKWPNTGCETWEYVQAVVKGRYPFAIITKNAEGVYYVYNKTTCMTCEGKGSVVCRQCGGRGVIQRGWSWSYCQECTRTGQKTCPTCNGAGTAQEKVVAEVRELPKPPELIEEEESKEKSGKGDDLPPPPPPYLKELQTKEIRCKKFPLSFTETNTKQQFVFNWTGNNQSSQTFWAREGEPIAKRDGADTGYTVVKLKEEKFEERDTPVGKMRVNVSTVIIRRNSDGEEIELVCGEKKDTDVIEAVLVFPKNDKWLRWLSEKQEFTLRDGTYRVVSINETEKTVTVEDTATGRISVIGVDGVVVPPETEEDIGKEEDDEEEEGTDTKDQELIGDSDDDSTADDTSGEDDGKSPVGTGEDDGIGPGGETPPDDEDTPPEDITFLNRLDKKMLRVWAKDPEASAYVRWAARNRLRELERK